MIDGSVTLLRSRRGLCEVGDDDGEAEDVEWADERRLGAVR